MTAVSGDLLNARNATIDDLVALLRDQQARKVDVVASASSVRAEGGCLVLQGTMPVLGADGVTMTEGRYRPTDVCDAGIAGKLGIPAGYLRRTRDSHPALFDANVNGWLGAGRAEVLHPRPAPRRRDRGRPGLAVGRVQEDRPSRHADGRLRRHPPGRAPGPGRDLRPNG